MDVPLGVWSLVGSWLELRSLIRLQLSVRVSGWIRGG